MASFKFSWNFGQCAFMLNPVQVKSFTKIQDRRFRALVQQKNAF